MKTTVEIENLSFTYPDGSVALNDVSLYISENETVGIVGANGAGKSTLVNHLNGYYMPQKGSIRVNNETLSRKTQENIRRCIGIVFQNPDDQLFTTRVYDDIAFGPQNLGIDEQSIHSTVETTMKSLGIWELRDKTPSHLSQGQKRFAAFASVLVMQPLVIVMDEPTSDLDPRNRRKLIHLVTSLGATQITVSHDLDFIWDTCKRVVIMALGTIIADGTTTELLSDQRLLEANGLELPLRLQK